MKKFFTFALLAAALSVTAFTQAEETSFPRKFLLEHFTGEDCGYCPYGMEAIAEFVKGQEDQYIWVSHHAGFAPDTYTIPANSTIATWLGVQGAPSMALNRAKQASYDNNGKPASLLVFHPGYLPNMTITDETTAKASVVLAPDYNADTRELSVKIDGQVADAAYSKLRLSVLIKENGLVSKQADYYNSWEGWSKFRHTRVVRAMLSNAKGDEVEVTSGTYSKTYTYTLPETWNAENCVVVAYITEAKTTVTPVINAEQAPVIAGKGGEELMPEGIEAIPVSDEYPEEGAPKAEIKMDIAGEYQDEEMPGFIILQMISNTTVNVRYGTQTYKCNPLLNLYVVWEQKKLAPGVYPINDSFTNGTVVAGFRNDEEFYTDGSILYYAYMQGNQFAPLGTWLCASGQLEVTENGGYIVSVTTRNGSQFVATYGVGTAINHVTMDGQEAVKFIKDGQLFIQRGENTYSPAGIRVE